MVNALVSRLQPDQAPSLFELKESQQKIECLFEFTKTDGSNTKSIFGVLRLLLYLGLVFCSLAFNGEVLVVILRGSDLVLIASSSKFVVPALLAAKVPALFGDTASPKLLTSKLKPFKV